MEDADADSSAHNEQQAATQHTALQSGTSLRPGASEPHTVYDLFAFFPPHTEAQFHSFTF